MNKKSAVEAALFSAASPITAKEIADKTGMPDSQVRELLKTLIEEYDSRDSAIQITKAGSEYRMQLREEFTDLADDFSEIELNKGMMKTVVTIAYNQPVMQSELFRNLGSRVYDDVRALREMGLVSGKRVGQSQELTTTKKFSEYFGISSTKPEDIRAWIEKRRN